MKAFLSTALAAFLICTSMSTASPVASYVKPDTATTSASAAGAPTFSPLTSAEIKDLQTELLLAASYKDKERVLFPPGNGGSANNVSFQFVNSPGTPPQDGSVIVGSVDSIPGLIGTNVAAAIGFIGPCGLNVPHLHPRANEFLTVVSGTLIGAFLLEQDAMFAGDIPQVAMTLTNFTGMLFPQGHTHWQFNPTCEQAVFAAAFDSNDEGRFQVAQIFFSSMPDDVLTASLGKPSFLGPTQLDKLRGLIPEAFVVMVDSCAQACGISTS